MADDVDTEQAGMVQSPLERATLAVKSLITDEMGMPFVDTDPMPPIAWEIARAVLEAIREPSDRMTDAYWDEVEGFPYFTGASENYPLATDAWQAMIDAALEEG